MFDNFKKRFRDAGTLQTLFASAERHANEEGQTEPGAEHLVLAAFELPDGTAGKTFERVGAKPASFCDAVDRQYVEALRAVGIEPSAAAPLNGDPPVSSVKGAYRAQASAHDLVYKLTETKPFDSALRLLGADIVIAAAAGRHTIAVRALRAMGVDPAVLATAAGVEIAAFAEKS